MGGSQQRQDRSWLDRIADAIGFGDDGVAGAAGRNAAVNQQMNAAYNLGYEAPQSSFSGDVYRNVNSSYASTMYDASHGATHGGRYNPSGNQLIYTSPSMVESIGETSAYNGMGGRTMVRSNYTAPFDPVTGTGGVADVTGLAQQRGMTGALTPEVGGSGPGLLHRITGEHPYTMTQQVGQGATDAGAGAIRAPSATGGNQLDIIPRNNNTGAITPLEMTPFDVDGNPGATTSARGQINPMAADGSPHTAGPVEFLPGDEIRPGGPSRAQSMRYGALGGGLMAFGTDMYRLSQGEDLSAGQVALDTGIGTAAGAGGAWAFDELLSRGASTAKAGGIIGGVVEGGMSLWNNGNAYANGEIEGSQAAANVVVDTGVGVGAGMAGAAAGAAIGSIIPGAGTAVGAALGFVGGMAGSYLVHALAEHSGFTDWAKEGLGDAFEWVGDGAGQLWDGATELGGDIADGAGALWNGATEVGGNLLEGAANLGGDIADGAGALWDGATEVGGSLVDGAANLGSAAWEGLTGWF